MVTAICSRALKCMYPPQASKQAMQCSHRRLMKVNECGGRPCRWSERTAGWERAADIDGKKKKEKKKQGARGRHPVAPVLFVQRGNVVVSTLSKVLERWHGDRSDTWGAEWRDRFRPSPLCHSRAASLMARKRICPRVERKQGQ